MFNELQRLCADERLFRLLQHYVTGNAEDREVWQGRVMQLEEVAPKELSPLHGELLAHDWIEQNTGNVGGCYRATPAGRRALKLAVSRQDEDGESLAA